jgi:mRNA interferase MazF
VVTRGDVRWYSDPRAGRRPFLVLTRAEAIPVLTGVLAVPVTRTVRGIPTEVPLDEADGLPGACALSLDNLTVVDRDAFGEPITRLGPAKMEAVCRALRVATAC